MTRPLLYAALVLASAGAPVNESTLRRVLRAAGAPVPALETRLLAELAAACTAPAERPQWSGASRLHRRALAPLPLPASPPERVVSAPATGGEDGDLYVYAVVPAGPAWPPIAGVDGGETFTVLAAATAAVVHRVPPGPPGTAASAAEPGALAERAAAHDAVVTRAMALFSTVLPMRMGTVARGRPGEGAADALQTWLDSRTPALLARLATLRGRAEYAVTVRLERAAAVRAVREGDAAVAAASAEAAAQTDGLRHLYERRLARVVDRRVDAVMAAEAEAIRAAVASHCVEVRTDGARPGDEDVVVRLSLLLEPAGADAVGRVLEPVAKRPGFEVRFTGPWPPYSFVDEVVGGAAEDAGR